jgi:hypothetical protein
MPLEDLPLEDLVLLCRRANEDYLHNRPHNDAYAYELFRRALAEGDTEALREMRDLFFPQFCRWVASHGGVPFTDETQEYFASAAFVNFYLAIRGEKFAKFDSLPKLLRYAKLCVGTAIAQYARDRANNDVPLPEVELHDRQSMTDDLEVHELWDHILDLLPTDKQRRLAYWVFVLKMKPAEIVAAYPEEWDNERSVSVAIYRIRKLLRDDEGLRNWNQSPD